MAAKLRTLSENEKKLFEIATDGDVEGVKDLLKQKDVRVNCLAETGMTVLQQCAFKGNPELCSILLSHGADVNSNYHEHGYTTLMFAALSGSEVVTRMVLEAGAKTHPQNSVGRTASQMAAFVGQHHLASIINNFFSQDQLDYYTKPHGLEKEGKLQKAIADPLYQLILMNNLHPVRLSMYLQSQPGILAESYSVTSVLDALCERMMKSSDTNDVMAIKFHYLACLIRESSSSWVDHSKNLDPWIKMLIRGRDVDGFPIKQELFVRSTLKSFPYPESQLLQQMIHNIAPVKLGDDPTALNILSSGINGQRFASDEQMCFTCGEGKAPNRCSACKMVVYCSAVCQKLHWSTHKKFCKQLAQEYKEMLERQIQQAEQEKKEMEETDICKIAESLAEKNKMNGSAEECIKQEDPTVNTESNGITDVLPSGDHNSTKSLKLDERILETGE